MNNLEQIQIIKRGDDGLKILFSLENASINLIGMMNFAIFELLFKINVDICDSYKMEVTDNENAKLTLVLKHILKDLGLQQMCADVLIARESREGLITIKITHRLPNDVEIVCDDDDDVDDDYEQIPLKSIVVKCDTTDPHKIGVCIDVHYNDATSIDTICGNFNKPAHNMQNFIDKMIKTLIKNIINRLKQFIEKMPYTSN